MGVFLPVRVLVLVFRFVFVFVMMGVRVISMLVLAQMNIEFYPGDAILVSSSGMDVVALEGQFAQLLVQLAQVEPQVQKCPDEHVTADSAEKIQVESFH